MKTIKHIFVIIVLLALGWVVWNTVSLRFRPIERKGLNTLTIMTYNTHRMGGFVHAPQNRVIRFLQETNADVVCLQEVEVYHDNNYLTLTELRNALAQYEYTYFDFKIYNNRRQFGNAVFSHYPLVHKQTVDFKSRSSISSRCDIVIGEDTLRLINNHLESNRLERHDFEMDSLSGENIKSATTHLWDKMRRARTIRHEQAQAVKREIKASPHPVLTVGDFNSLPLSYVYQKIKFGQRDAFLESNRWKVGNTWSKYGLGVRIDYILTSKKLTPIKTEVIRVNHSDHYPVCATIGWAPDSDNP